MITIPGTDMRIAIPSKEEPEIERIGVSAAVAARMLGVSERTVWKLSKNGVVRTSKIGKRTIFSVQSLRELVDGTNNV